MEEITAQDAEREETWRMIEQCMRHQLPWDYNQHAAEQIQDGVRLNHENEPIYGQGYLNLNMDDLPPAGAYYPIDPLATWSDDERADD